MKRIVTNILLCLATVLAVGVVAVPPAAAAVPPPYAEHHAHLFSPVTAAMASEPPLPAVEVPPELAAVLHAHEAAWNDAAALRRLFTADATLLNLRNDDYATWIRGAEAVSGALAETFSRPYRITPVASHFEGNAAQVSGYFTRGDGAEMRRFGHVLLSLVRGEDGAWRIAAEAPAFPGPPSRTATTAEDLIAQLDDAGIRKATVLSVAYWFGDPTHPVADEYAKVKAENDWVAAGAARHPDRLVAFCGLNPLRDYAVAEVERCATLRGVRGIKLHLGNSRVDLRDPAQAERVAAVFRAANARRLAIVVHLWTGPEYEEEGAAFAEAFLTRVLPAAPDVTVQVAHLAGGGRSTDAALAVLANRIAVGDARTRHLYFDVATSTEGQTREGLEKDAMRMRQIGLDRILFGSDAAPPNPPSRESWQLFRARMPLSDEELRTIAGNVVPYLRDVPTDQTGR